MSASDAERTERPRLASVASQIAVTLHATPSLAGRSISPFLLGPAKPLQVEAVPVVELDAFLFQQALLEGAAAIAGR
jgi:hypothetical protein